ncbi:uncharacterized protein LOC143275235 [Babylonia areolata]|uniref:uncharacterized protein LOC143275235 n=1 Tax=Babylonia areolata TaxID=304850 RepID=UPI003FD572F3
MWDAAAKFCADFPELVFAHPGDCALSYNCRHAVPDSSTRGGSLLPYEAECSPPQLFDVRTLTCVERPATADLLAALCGSRTLPEAAPCEGQTDGNHADRKRPFSQHYVICQNGGLQGEATCSMKGQIFDPVLRQCTYGIRDDSVATFCSNNPSALFADPYHCARHFDCSRVTWQKGLRAKQSECTYPLLYDVNSTSCINFDLVDCGNRAEPIQPCDYIIGRCLDRPECIPCEASCLGLPNGYSAYPGHVLTPYHILCRSERTVDILNCSTGLVFDPQLRSCGPEISLRTLDLYCSENPTGKLAHPSECSLLYDCQQLTVKPNFPKYVSECKYPYLVDPETMECKPHDQVSCDYLGYKCTSTNCQKCELVMPSCYGKLNGYFPVINQEMTSSFMECRDQRVVKLDACTGGLIFDITHRKCVSEVSRESLFKFCTTYLTGRVQIPTNCAQYYDCTKNLTDVQECRYPMLYDVGSQECKDYPTVQCNNRPLFLDPCDSYTFCPVAPCPYCPTAFPTCERRNGDTGGFRFDNTLFYRCVDGRMILGRCSTKFDPRTKLCLGQVVTTTTTTTTTTTIAVTTTPGAVTTSEITTTTLTTTTTPITTTTAITTTTTTTPTTTTKKTTTTTLSTTTPPLDINATCRKDPGFVAPKKDNCAQFYNCSNPISPLGAYVSECAVGQLFDMSLGRCLPRHLVMCIKRPPPLQVYTPNPFFPQLQGHYKLKQCPFAKPSGGCLPCRERFPSCWGMRDGPLALPRQLSPSYVTCHYGRVTAIRQCPPGQYLDPSRLMCTAVLTTTTTTATTSSTTTAAAATTTTTTATTTTATTAHPSGVTPHPLHCARFIVCKRFSGSPSAIALGGECPYPQLFSLSGRCQPFRHVQCRARYEPRAPCEYASLQQCRVSGRPQPTACPVCEERLPSCVGLPDGNRVYPGRLFSPWFVRCDTGRTMAIVRCVNAFFDPLTNKCRASLEEIRNIAKLCRQYPRAIVADPLHCGRFYNCSRSYPGVIGRDYLSECRFPSLFNRKTLACDSFLQVVRHVGCGGSKEPLHQCEYSSYCPGTRYRTCHDCYGHVPSCLRVPNGLHTVPPGRPSSPSFVYCLDQRALLMSQCPAGSLYLSASKSCVPARNVPVGAGGYLDPLLLAAAGVEPPEIW